MNSSLKLWNLRKRLIGRSGIKIFADEFNKVLKQMSIIFFIIYMSVKDGRKQKNISTFFVIIIHVISVFYFSLNFDRF